MEADHDPVTTARRLLPMMSQYQFSTSDKREEAQSWLGGLGYDVRDGGTDGRDLLIVHHPDAYVARVDDIVRKVDPAARRV